MNTDYNFSAQRPIETIAAAFAATLVALSLLLAIGSLFQSRGAPLERLAAAERACADKAYQSERHSCMSQWLDESQPTKVAAQ